MVDMDKREKSVRDAYGDRPGARYTGDGEGIYMAARLDEVFDAMRAAGLKSGDRFIDLGSGDGRVVCAAAALGAAARGVELDESLHARALDTAQSLIADHPRLDIRLGRGDFFDEDLKDWDVIFYYGGGNTKRQRKLYARLESELKPGARLIIYRTARDPALQLTLLPVSHPPVRYVYQRIVPAPPG